MGISMTFGMPLVTPTELTRVGFPSLSLSLLHCRISGAIADFKSHAAAAAAVHGIEDVPEATLSSFPEGELKTEVRVLPTVSMGKGFLT